MMNEQKKNFENQEPVSASGTAQVREDTYPSEDIEKGKTWRDLHVCVGIALNGAA